jgi:hypothetical protein
VAFRLGRRVVLHPLAQPVTENDRRVLGISGTSEKSCRPVTGSHPLEIRTWYVLPRFSLPSRIAETSARTCSWMTVSVPMEPGLSGVGTGPRMCVITRLSSARDAWPCRRSTRQRAEQRSDGSVVLVTRSELLRSRATLYCIGAHIRVEDLRELICPGFRESVFATLAQTFDFLGSPGAREVVELGPDDVPYEAPA